MHKVVSVSYKIYEVETKVVQLTWYHVCLMHISGNQKTGCKDVHL